LRSRPGGNSFARSRASSAKRMRCSFACRLSRLMQRPVALAGAQLVSQSLEKAQE
jgi:hypothetical protein